MPNLLTKHKNWLTISTKIFFQTKNELTKIISSTAA